jgi:GR25 family glycosyltransferase involved in LPS biosynthesis
VASYAGQINQDTFVTTKDLPAGWRAYLINLPERKDRLRFAKRELSSVGWQLGPGGVCLYAANKFKDRGRFPSPSIRGCFMSHSDCLGEASRQGMPNTLMLEDDVAFASSFPILLPSILSQLEAIDWGFCYLGHEDTGNIDRANSRTRDVNLIPYNGELRTTHFYLVNGRILPRLLEHLDRLASGEEGDQKNGPMPIDGAINRFRLSNGDIKTVIADPKLGWQRPSRSDISPGRIDQWRLLYPTVEGLRSLKHKFLRWWV